MQRLENQCILTLEARDLPYDMIAHPYAATAMECAEAAHVPGAHLAKSVLIHMEEGPMLAVIRAGNP